MCEVFTIKDIEYKKEPYCEHCGDLEPFTATFEDGASWCIWCGLHGDLQLTEEDKRHIEIIETTKKIGYFKNRIAELEKLLGVEGVVGELNEEN